MRQVHCVVIMFLMFMLACVSGFAQKKAYILPKKSPEELREDVIILQKILEANHPGLYWYTPKDSMDLFFANTIHGITDSLDELQFKNKVSELISKIRCGHTSVRFSKSYIKRASRFHSPQFPLFLKAWGDSLVVVNSLFRNDPVFKRGTIITGINGRTNRELLDTFFQFIPSDGYAFNYKNVAVSGNFPGWYKTVLGLDSAYQVSYIDSTGNEKTAFIGNYNASADTLKKENQKPLVPFVKPTRKQLRKESLLAKRNMVIDTALSTAFIHLSTFTDGRLKRFFKRSFKIIQQYHLQHVVIDLRENGGGNVSKSILLTQYLTDHPFKVGDSIVAISRKFQYGRYIHPWFSYWMAMNFTSHKTGDGLIHFSHYEKKSYQPKEKFHFNGHITLLQGGLSFSATTMFISSLKGQKNITVVGEETGGGFYGNSAMYIPTIRLPNTGLRISLPLYRLVMDATRPKGHGIVPDIEIAPSSVAIKNGADLKMERIRELILQKVL